MIGPLVLTGVVALAGWLKFYAEPKRRRLQKQEIERLTESALKSLDRIVENRHYRGSECEVVATFWTGGVALSTQPYTTRYFPFAAQQLCRTKSGSWFLFDVESSDVKPCDEMTARNRISHDIELFTRVFGVPVLA